MEPVILKRETELIPGTFLTRPNRFLAQVEVMGEETLAHVPDPGRLKELLIPGSQIYLRPVSGQRKTKFDLVLVKHGDLHVSLESTLPNRLVEQALRQGFFAELAHFPNIRREVTYGDSRLDFFLSSQEEQCFLEVKSVTLVKEKRALFPDAPTARGTRHLEELIKIKEAGMGAIALFIIQRDDANSFSPYEKLDPLFSATLQQAAEAGVEVWAYKCKNTLDEIRLIGKVPVEYF